jgi:hypothetical protein
MVGITAPAATTMHAIYSTRSYDSAKSMFWALSFLIVLVSPAISITSQQLGENVSDLVLRGLQLKECRHSRHAAVCSWVNDDGVQIVDQNIARNGWVESASRWKLSSLHDAFEISDAINAEVLGHHRLIGKKTENEADERFLPAFVLNNPTSTDRGKHIQILLRSIGIISSVSFLPFTEAEDINITQLIQWKIIDQTAIDLMLNSSWIGPRALPKYIANAIDHMNAINIGIDAGYEFFGVFEDDLMLAGSPETVGHRIRSALRKFPPTADMLYLEACFETCSERKFSYHYPMWAKTTGPSCSAAIIFTRKGAQRISYLSETIFWGLDNMYAAMIRAGLLEAYVITPTAFFQDGYWSSGLQHFRAENRKIGDRARAGPTHRPFAFLCIEMENELSLVHVQISAETNFLMKCFGGHTGGSHPRKLMLISDTLTLHPEKDMDMEAILYFTKAANDSESWVQVGQWRKAFLDGVVLWIESNSFCFSEVEFGGCMLKIQARYDEDIDDGATTFVHVSDLLFVNYRIETELDILLHPFRQLPALRISSSMDRQL